MKATVRRSIAAAATALVIGIAGCSAPDSSPASGSQSAVSTESETPAWGTHVDTAQFKQFIDEDDPVVIDVRTAGEYAQGHLPGALNIDVNDPGFKDEITKLDQNGKYAIYCRSGSRSQAAQAILRDAGFENTLGLKGGIGAWSGPIE